MLCELNAVKLQRNKHLFQYIYNAGGVRTVNCRRLRATLNLQNSNPTGENNFFCKLQNFFQAPGSHQRYLSKTGEKYWRMVFHEVFPEQTRTDDAAGFPQAVTEEQT